MNISDTVINQYFKKYRGRIPKFVHDTEKATIWWKKPDLMNDYDAYYSYQWNYRDQTIFEIFQQKGFAAIREIIWNEKELGFSSKDLYSLAKEYKNKRVVLWI